MTGLVVFRDGVLPLGVDEILAARDAAAASASEAAGYVEAAALEVGDAESARNQAESYRDESREARDEAIAQLELVAGMVVSSLSALLDSTQGYALNSIITTRAEGYIYEVVASDADLMTAGGVGLRVLHNGTVHPGAFGAAPGGALDAAAAIKAALASTAQVIDGGGETFRVDSRLDLPANITLSNMVLDFSQISELTGSARVMLRAEGAGIVDSAVIPATIMAGVYSVTVDAGQGTKFSAGDYVQITSEQTYPYSGATVKRGEIKRVRSVAGDVVTFREAVYEGYNVSSGALNLRRLSLAENITLDNVRVVGTNVQTNQDRGFVATWTKGLRVKNCAFEKIDTYCCALFNCVEFNVSDNRIEGVYYESAGTAFYGIVIFNCCQWGVIHGNIGEEVRHLVTVSSSAMHYGQPYHYTVSSNMMHNAMAGAGTDSWAYENHGFGRWGTWVGNVADGCRVGFNMEKGDQVLVGNIVRNFSLYGFYVDNSGQDVNNLLVSGNLFDGPSYPVPSGTVSGLRIEQEAASVRRNIRITDNIFRLYSAVGTPTRAIMISDGSGAAQNCVIDGNTINNIDGVYEVTDFGIYVTQPGWVIDGNSILGFERGIYISPSAHDTTVQGNQISLATPGATQPALEIRANNCTAIGNVFRNAFRAISVFSTADGATVAGNVQFGSVNTALYDVGTNTKIGFTAETAF